MPPKGWVFSFSESWKIKIGHGKVIEFYYRFFCVNPVTNVPITGKILYWVLQVPPATYVRFTCWVEVQKTCQLAEQLLTKLITLEKHL